MPEGEVTGTFGDYSPTNTSASEQPSTYEVCQQSGFKVKPKELVKQWDGAWVRHDFLDKRNPQDFVRGGRERPKPRQGPPEQTDEFIDNGNFIQLEQDERLLGAEVDSPMRTEERASTHVSAGDL